LRAVDGALRVATGETLWPRDLVIREVHRFEGVSDPDDMEVLYAIESASGVRGTLADAFGVYADPTTAAGTADGRPGVHDQGQRLQRLAVPRDRRAPADRGPGCRPSSFAAEPVPGAVSYQITVVSYDLVSLGQMR
jgi:hypothetical protein